MKIKVVSDAEWKTGGPTQHDFLYRAVMRYLQGKAWPEATGIRRGVADAAYIILPKIPPKARHDLPLQSKVVMIEPRLIETRVEDNVNHRVPVSKDHMQYKLFREKEGLETVRILTPWVDGFTAFVREPARKRSSK